MDDGKIIEARSIVNIMAYLSWKYFLTIDFLGGKVEATDETACVNHIHDTIRITILA